MTDPAAKTRVGITSVLRRYHVGAVIGAAVAGSDSKTKQSRRADGGNDA